MLGEVYKILNSINGSLLTRMTNSFNKFFETLIIANVTNSFSINFIALPVVMMYLVS